MKTFVYTTVLKIIYNTYVRGTIVKRSSYVTLLYVSIYLWIIHTLCIVWVSTCFEVSRGLLVLSCCSLEDCRLPHACLEQTHSTRGELQMVKLFNPSLCWRHMDKDTVSECCIQPTPSRAREYHLIKQRSSYSVFCFLSVYNVLHKSLINYY